MGELIITCDDYGLSEGVNNAAIDLYRRGMINNVSVMTNADATKHGLELLTHNLELKSGVHLDLLEGHSLTGKTHKGTRSDNYLKSRGGLLKYILNPSKNNMMGIKEEFTQQVEVLKDAGFTLEHLTTHLHFHMQPQIKNIMWDLARDYSARWVRSHRPTHTLLPFKPVPKKIRVSGYQGSFFVPDYLVPLSSWTSFDPERLLGKIKSLPGSVEIVVHPYEGSQLDFPKGIAYPVHKRVKEKKYLERLVDIMVRDKLRVKP